MSSNDIADLIGKPFRYGGRGPFEYDCYGLCREIYHRRGITLPDFASSEDAQVNHMSIEVGKRHFEEIPAPAAFCLVTFFMQIPGITTHVGVVLPDKLHFIHVTEKTRVAVERLDSLLWHRRITGFYKFSS